MNAMTRALLLAAVAGLAGCQAPGGGDDYPPGPGTEDLHIHLFTDGQRLGGYTFLLTWDPSVAVVTRVRPEPGGVKFPGRPEHQGTSQFNAGSLRIWGITSDRDYDVPAEYHVVAVTFRPLKPGVSVKPEVQIKALYDAKKKPKPIQGRLNTFPQELTFKQ
jgi:hypothetical protein